MVALAWLYGPIAPVPAFIPISWRTGPFTTAIVAIALELLLRAVTPVAARARMTGKYSGRAPAITAFTATFSTVYSQCSRKCVERIRPTTSSGFRRVPSSMPPPAPRWAARWAACPSSGCRGRAARGSPRCPARRAAGSSGRTRAGLGQPPSKGRVRPSTTSCMTGRPVIGIHAVDVGAELGGRLAHDGLRHEHLPQAGHAVDRRHRSHDPVELVGVHSHGGDAVLAFDRHRVRGDRRRAGASVADTDDGGVPRARDLLPRRRDRR